MMSYVGVQTMFGKETCKMVQGEKGLLWEKTMLWHKILWYIGEKGLQKLHGKGMVKGKYDCTLDFHFFGHCIYSKYSMVKFLSSAKRENGTQS